MQLQTFSLHWPTAAPPTDGRRGRLAVAVLALALSLLLVCSAATAGLLAGTVSAVGSTTAGTPGPTRSSSPTNATVQRASTNVLPSARAPTNEQSSARGPATTPPVGLRSLASASATVRGGSAGDRVGWAVSATGDVNGDGVPDLVVGAPGHDVSGVGDEAGAVYVFYGPVAPSNVSTADADAVLLGPAAGDRAGFALATGDVNGDGVDDLVVGAPFDDEGGTDAGAAYVVFGGSLSGRQSLADADEKLVGEAANNTAGFAVAVRSVASPDTPAILVGAPTGPAKLDTGSAYLLSVGSRSGTTALADADAKLNGATHGDRAGSALAWAGDVTGDGVPDVLVGAPRHNGSGPRTGAVYVVPATSTGVANLRDAATATLGGVAAGDSAGFALAAGDVNGDGVPDVLVGAPGSDRRTRDAGAAYVVYGSSSLDGTRSLDAANVTITGEAAGDHAGWSVAAGDVDCDGTADVLVGAPFNDAVATNAGAAYVLYGRASSGGFRAAKFLGRAAADLAGWTVEAGNLTADHASDVLVGAPTSDARRGHGAAYLTPGSCSTNASRTRPADGRLGDSGAIVHSPVSHSGSARSDTPRGTSSSPPGATASRGPGPAVQEHRGGSHTGDSAKRSPSGPGGTGSRSSTGDSNVVGSAGPGTGSGSTGPTTGGTSGGGGNQGGEPGGNQGGEPGGKTGDGTGTGGGPAGDGGGNGGQSGSGSGGGPAPAQRQSLTIVQHQCQRQTPAGQSQTQSQGLVGSQRQGVGVGQFQELYVEQTQCQQQAGGDAAQVQRQFLVVEFAVQRQTGTTTGQHQSASVGSDQSQRQRATDAGRTQTQIQAFSVTFLFQQAPVGGAAAVLHRQSQHVHVSQTETQAQSGSADQAQRQYQRVTVVYQGQRQVVAGHESQTQSQSLAASQRQAQARNGTTSRQAEAQGVGLTQGQNQTQNGTTATQRQNQSLVVDQGQRQRQPGQRQRQNQTAAANQTARESGGNQTQNQTQSLAAGQRQTQSRSTGDANSTSNSSVGVEQAQRQRQANDSNQSQTQSLVAGQRGATHQSPTTEPTDASSARAADGSEANATANASEANATANASDADPAPNGSDPSGNASVTGARAGSGPEATSANATTENASARNETSAAPNETSAPPNESTTPTETTTIGASNGTTASSTPTTESPRTTTGDSQSTTTGPSTSTTTAPKTTTTSTATTTAPTTTTTATPTTATATPTTTRPTTTPSTTTTAAPATTTTTPPPTTLTTTTATTTTVESATRTGTKSESTSTGSVNETAPANGTTSS